MYVVLLEDTLAGTTTVYGPFLKHHLAIDREQEFHEKDDRADETVKDAESGLETFRYTTRVVTMISGRYLGRC